MHTPHTFRAPRDLARAALATAFAALAMAAPCAAAALERSPVLMGTVLRVRLSPADSAAGERALAAAVADVARLERVMSSWDPGSELTRLNAALDAAPVGLSRDLAAVLDSALALAAFTDGAFDPTVEPLLAAWDVRGRGRTPSARERRDALACVGHARLALERDAGRLRAERAGVRVDLGGIGKGFALDRAAARLAGDGPGSLDFGGQWLVWGDSAAAIAVAHPADRLRPAAWLHVTNASVATSAQSESPARAGGRPVHVLDPRTGLPADAHASVTAVCASATRADALSTALLVMGRDGAEAFAARHPDVGVLWMEPARGRVRAWCWNLPAATFAAGVDVMGCGAKNVTPALDTRVAIENKRVRPAGRPFHILRSTGDVMNLRAAGPSAAR